MIELYFDGIIPSKKNNRDIFVNRGRLVNRPNEKYRGWHAVAQEDTLPQVEDYPIPLQARPVFIAYLFTMPDMRRRDLSNMQQSIEDLLVDMGVFTDDAWEYLQTAGALAVHKKGISNCTVWIEDNLTDTFEILRKNYEKLLTQ